LPSWSRLFQRTQRQTHQFHRVFLLITSGFSISVTRLGLPHVGFISYDEIIDQDPLQENSQIKTERRDRILFPSQIN